MREPDLTEIDYHSLTTERWEQLHRDILLRAQTARGQALRHLFVGVLTLLRAGGRAAASAMRVPAERIASLLGRWWHAYVSRRERKAAVRELHGLDDRALRDIGISRSEIESVVYCRDETRLRDATIVAERGRRSETRPSPTMKFGARKPTPHLARKSAA
jgi:uncharacterized protein YjiS (DUF1127 family)